MEIFRENYVKKLIEWKDKHVIKVVTGVRRSGKSTILKQYLDTIKKEFKIGQNQFQEYDFNDIKLQNLTYMELYDLIIGKSVKNKTNYIFLNEIQEIKDFEKTVISLFENKKIDFDICITGSNSKMFSASLATLFTGRNIEIKVYPLSFNEFYHYAKEKMKLEKNEIFNIYLKFGGLAILLDIIDNETFKKERLSTIVADTINKDIKNRHTIRNIVDFERIAQYAFDNIGHVFSVSKISSFINSNNKTKITPKTIDRYLMWLCEALLLYKVPFFNTTGKRILKTSGKYYAVDSGIKNAELKFKIVNIGSLIENLVYIELLRRGYDVVIGRLYDGREIDFIAMKFNEIIYIQVTEHIFDDEKLMQREIGNLRTIKDNRKKIVLSLYDISHETEDGIEILNLIDWLLEK